jgi:CelD/BcsL family acetyltransferase involved in cellulose biosynthesis
VIRIETITCPSELSKLRAEWIELEASVPFFTPFHTSEWLLTWWRHFGSGHLRVLAVRSGDQLAGLIPMFLHEWEGKRQLTLIGSGISDYLEPAIEPDLAMQISGQLWRHLAAMPDWDLCNWQDLAADSAIDICAAGHPLVVNKSPDLPCSEIPIDGDFSTYWNTRPSGLRRNLRRYRDKAEQIAAIEIEITETVSEECLKALIGLHSARWREQGEPGTIAANRSAAFLRDVVQALAGRNGVLFFALRFQGEIAAVILAFPYRATIYAYLSAFDPVHAAFGFGRTLLYEALCYCFARKYKAWNFLRGDEPYKFEWGAREIKKARLIVARDSASLQSAAGTT